MVELKKVRDRIYLLPVNFKMTDDQAVVCTFVLGRFRFGTVKAPELGSDGILYDTHQNGVEFSSDADAVTFMLLTAGPDDLTDRTIAA